MTRALPWKTGYGTPVSCPRNGAGTLRVGIVARGSGLNLDCRLHNPFPPYDKFEVNVPVLISGDVHARVWVRVEEIRGSIRIIGYIVGGLPPDLYLQMRDCRLLTRRALLQ